MTLCLPIQRNLRLFTARAFARSNLMFAKWTIRICCLRLSVVKAVIGNGTRQGHNTLSKDLRLALLGLNANKRTFHAHNIAGNKWIHACAEGRA